MHGLSNAPILGWDFPPNISSWWCVIEKTSLGENIYSPNGKSKESLSHWLFPSHHNKMHIIVYTSFF